MELSKTFELHHSLKIEPGDLQHLVGQIQKAVGAISLEVRCNDGATLKPESLEELLGYENPSFRRVTEILISSRATDKASVHVYLGAGDFPTRGSVRVELWFQDHTQCQAMEAELRQRFKDFRPWYAWFSVASLAWLFPAFFLLKVFAAAAGTGFAKLQGYRLPEVPSQNPLTENEAIVLLFLLLGAFAALGFVADRFREYFFPRMVFLAGKQVARFQRSQKILWGVFGVIGLGVVSNVIASWLLA